MKWRPGVIVSSKWGDRYTLGNVRIETVFKVMRFNNIDNLLGPSTICSGGNDVSIRIRGR